MSPSSLLGPSLVLISFHFLSCSLWPLPRSCCCRYGRVLFDICGHFWRHEGIFLLVTVDGIFALFCLFLVERLLHILDFPRISLFFSNGSLSASSFCGSSFLVGTFWVECTPCCYPDMCPIVFPPT